VAAFGLAPLSEAAFPSAPVGSVSDLSPEDLEPPSEREQIFSAIKTPESLFWALVIVLSAIILSVLGWWREVGLNGPSRWKNLYLLVFPVVIVALAFSGGVTITGPSSVVAPAFVALVSVLGEELLFRGVLFRALVPAGALWAVVLTSFLAGALYMGRSLLNDPWTEAIYVTVLTVCGGFTYGALRWRTASLWPVLTVHLALAFALDAATVGGTVFPILVFCVTLGFIFYGLLLLRSSRVRADGGPSLSEEPARAL